MMFIHLKCQNATLTFRSGLSKECNLINYPVQAVLALGSHADALVPPGQALGGVRQGDLARNQGDELPILPVVKQKPSPHHHTQPRFKLNFEVLSTY